MPLLKPFQLTVLTTSNCTAKCAHCSVRSGPGRKDRLTYEDIRAAIERLHGFNRLNTIVFAGGEPTLLGDDLLNAIAYADERGINTRMVTNAYWAVSYDRARRKLRELREAGLREVNISADDYHLPYVPFERVVNAWKASKGMGFGAVIIANSHGPNSKVNPEFVMSQIGEWLETRYDDDGYEQPYSGPAEDGTLYGLSNSQVQLLGRAHEHLSADDVVYPVDQAGLDKKCRWAGRSPALSPRNHLVACCGMEAEGNEVLDFGDATTEDHLTLVERADDNLIVNAIAYVGPRTLMRFIQERAPAISFRERYASVCEICEHVVSRPECVDVLRKHAGVLATHVLEARRAEEQDQAVSAPALPIMEPEAPQALPR
jgi:hypothetical protein